ncbi:MAG: hypothetical protein VX527_05680, partial [Planctomycetota bacterium]|nr:hypothetical protein [Planctomycetota bacterium]
MASLVMVGTASAATRTVCSGGCDYSNIQDAINASSSGDTITISAGTYSEHGLQTLGKNVTIEGTLNSDGSLATTIDGEGAGSVFDLRVSGGGARPVFKNLVITGGSADYGGGIYCKDATVRVIGCEIDGNTSIKGGGGIYCGKDGSVLIRDCTVSNNSATDSSNAHGGGVWCDQLGVTTIALCTVQGNTAYSGGGVSCNGSVSISSCDISSNVATGGGGGISVGSAYIVIVYDCDI